jgi:pimeloyl-ACP methyl ester carboxylesterase
MNDMDTPQRLDVNGVDVAYRRAGSGPPLLYLHGMGLTNRWLNLYEVLAERFDTIVPDHPGWGGTVRPAWYRGVDDLAVHYTDFLDALGLDAVHVIGHSFGGRLAGEFAALFPQRVLSLTLITPAPLSTVSPADAMDDDEEPPEGFDFDSVLFNDNQAAYEPYRNGDDLGQSVRAADDDHSVPDQFSFDTSPSLYRRLARVRAPAQVLIPDEDRLIPHEHFHAWAHWLGDAPVVTIPGGAHPTGHLMIVQEPRAIADQVAGLSATT